MAVPKRKTSKTRRDKRRTHANAPKVTVAICQQCKKPVAPHTACAFGGYYNNKKVLTTREEAREQNA